MNVMFIVVFYGSFVFEPHAKRDQKDHTVSNPSKVH